MDERGSPQDAVHRRPILERTIGPAPGLRWLVAAIVAVSIASALLARLLAPSDFPTLGVSFWWAVQTVTTVGYGDVTPTSTEGRAVGALLMIAGVAAISLVTAAIAAGFVNRVQSRRSAEFQNPVLRSLERIEARLDEVERRLPERPSE